MLRTIFTLNLCLCIITHDKLPVICLYRLNLKHYSAAYSEEFSVFLKSSKIEWWNPDVIQKLIMQPLNVILHKVFFFRISLLIVLYHRILSRVIMIFECENISNKTHQIEPGTVKNSNCTVTKLPMKKRVTGIFLKGCQRR